MIDTYGRDSASQPATLEPYLISPVNDCDCDLCSIHDLWQGRSTVKLLASTRRRESVSDAWVKTARLELWTLSAEIETVGPPGRHGTMSVHDSADGVDGTVVSERSVVC